MNLRLIANTAGYVLWVEAGFMLLPMVVSAVYRENCWLSFLLIATLCGILGSLMHQFKPRQQRLNSRDGFVAVSLSWILLALFGAIPYMLTGVQSSYIDALFETVSGLTTTGATVFADVESLPRTILFWRSLTQWMGGMGVLVLFLALMPKLGEGSVFLMRAESPGPIKSRLVPRLGGTAKILYVIYVVLTLLLMVCLRLVGEDWFFSINHALTTMATGGFSTLNTSLVGKSDGVLWVITVFSFLSGINFAVLFAIVCGKAKAVLRSEELRFYLGTVAGTALLLGLHLFVRTDAPFARTATDVVFQTVTIISTTGFATLDFSLWPSFCRMALVLLMFTGSCAGSTSGGIKLSRVIIMCKSLKRELKRLAHPNHVSVVKMDGQVVEERVVAATGAFITAYLLVLLSGAVIVSWDGLGFQESFAASLTCISNVGPALGLLDSIESFALLSPVSKLALSLEMLMGRLELLPVIALLLKSTWRD